MASAAILAVIRAAAPSFRSPQDQLAFAVHAAVLTSGYRLVAVGEDAQLEGLSTDAPDVGVAGWNSSSDQYSFAYLSEELEQQAGSSSSTASQAAAAAAAAAAAPIKLLVKALVLGDTLLTTLATDNTATEPRVLELPVADYVIASGSPAGGIAKTYKNLDQLAKTLASAMSEVTGLTAAAATSPSQKKQKTAEAGTDGGGSSAAAAAAAAERQGTRGPEQQPDPDYDPLRIGPPRRPVPVGRDDIMPVLGGGGLGGVGMPPGMVGPTGGGMHVGPGHPFFADRMRHPDLMPGRGIGGGGMPGGPGGVRWDPINPEGLEGWRPEDFQRRGPRPPFNPDIMPPGPGRGADWDNMFG